MLGLFSKLNWRATWMASGAMLIPALILTILERTLGLGFWTSIVLISITCLGIPMVVGTLYGWLAQPFGSPFDLRSAVLGGLVSALISALILNLMFSLFFTKELFGTDTSPFSAMIEVIFSALLSALPGALGSVIVARYKSSQRIPVNNSLAELQNGNVQQRRAASHKLSKSNAVEAVPALIKASNDTDSFVREDAINGLRKIGSKEALDYLKSQEIPTKENHSSWGILSLIVSLIMIFVGGLIIFGPLFDFIIEPRLGFEISNSVYLILTYCIGPVGILVGVVLANIGLREKNSNKQFCYLGLAVSIFASLPMLFMWVLGLMQGMPFSCLDSPSFCGW